MRVCVRRVGIKGALRGKTHALHRIVGQMKTVVHWRHGPIHHGWSKLVVVEALILADVRIRRSRWTARRSSLWVKGSLLSPLSRSPTRSTPTSGSRSLSLDRSRTIAANSFTPSSLAISGGRLNPVCGCLVGQHPDAICFPRTASRTLSVIFECLDSRQKGRVDLRGREHTWFMDRLCRMLFCHPFEPDSCGFVVFRRNHSYMSLSIILCPGACINAS